MVNFANQRVHDPACGLARLQLPGLQGVGSIALPENMQAIFIRVHVPSIALVLGVVCLNQLVCIMWLRCWMPSLTRGIARSQAYTPAETGSQRMEDHSLC